MKILNSYTPIDDFEKRVTPSFVRKVQVRAAALLFHVEVTGYFKRTVFVATYLYLTCMSSNDCTVQLFTGRLHSIP